MSHILLKYRIQYRLFIHGGVSATWLLYALWWQNEKAACVPDCEFTGKKSPKLLPPNVGGLGLCPFAVLLNVTWLPQKVPEEITLLSSSCVLKNSTR